MRGRLKQAAIAYLSALTATFYIVGLCIMIGTTVGLLSSRPWTEGDFAILIAIVVVLVVLSRIGSKRSR